MSIPENKRNEINARISSQGLDKLRLRMRVDYRECISGVRE